MARKRFKNVSDTLQVLYDETGDKREIVPGGTILLEEKWGAKFGRFLTLVETGKGKKATEDVE